MSIAPNAFTLSVGLVVVLGVAIHARRLVRYLREGELHALTSAGGEGMLGHVARAEKPGLFWVLWAGKLAFLLALIIAVFYWAFFS